MNTPRKYENFNIIRHLNSPKEGTLPDGKKVEALSTEAYTFFEGPGGDFVAVKAAPYDNHFIYMLPPEYQGSTFRCSCGSPAVYAGLDGYKKDASRQGLLLLCLSHANIGKHGDGSS